MYSLWGCDTTVDKNSVTVIIPARNEQKNIEKIVNLVKQNEIVGQLIVVDNNSSDDTAQIAKNAGAQVVHCEKQGKGYAMELGLQFVENDIIAFLDADIEDYDENLVDMLTMDISADKADFVKSTFERKGGRVTELVAKPLLKIAYPNMHRFSQPLSGMIAGKTEFFKKISLEKDYGVDIGILLDMIGLNARINEVCIGKITNDSHDWSFLDKMAEEVMNAIIKRRYSMD